MREIERLDAYRTSALTFQIDGQRRTLPHPEDLSIPEILTALEDGLIAEMLERPLKPWQSSVLFGRWRAHHDIPDFRDAQKLCYLVDRYRWDLTYDLRHEVGVDLAEMFQARRWGTLGALIDRLPRTSCYSESAANDEEHAEALAKAMAEQPERPGTKNPALRTWTEEAEMGAKVLDAIHALQATVTALAGGKASQPKPTPRPLTALERARVAAENDRKKRSHQKLVARMLPHKAAETS